MDRVEQIEKKYLNAGYFQVEFALVGHSLGAITSAKYIWRHISHSKVTMMISLAGRLKYVKNKFWWFCEDVKSDIEKTYKAISNDPNKVLLYTVRGDRDGIVPKESVHIEASKEKCTVEGWGHGGIVFAPKAQKKVVYWVQNWV